MKRLIFTVWMLFCSARLFAQPVSLPESDENITHSINIDQKGAPIDGGLSILIFLVAAYGAKEIYSMRKAKKKKSE